MKRWPGMLAGAALALTCANSAHALEAVASIKPVHSLVAAVMEGVGSPALIVKGAGSPHVYSMRPSEATALESADVVFWVGPGLEAFLRQPLKALASDAALVALSNVPGLTKLPLREGGTFEQHRDEAGHKGEDARQDGPAESGIDMHMWLDPENARAMAMAIEKALAAADPDHANIYAANAAALAEKLESLVARTKAALADVKDRPFIVFHDAYRYYEHRFGLSAAGSITVSPETTPGAARLSQIRRKIADLGAACVFAEPEFRSTLIDVATEGTRARAGVLDPLGADIPDGPDLYFRLIGNMTASFRNCFSKG